MKIKGQVDMYNVKGWKITKDYDAPTNKTTIKIEKGFYSEYPVCYGKGQIGYDHPERIPSSVKLKLKSLCKK